MGAVVSPCLWCSFLLNSFPSSVQSPSHEIQSSRNCSDMGPSHGLQFFKNCSSVGLFQESPMGCSSMLEQVFWQGCSSWQEGALLWDLHRLQLSSGHIHLLCWVLHGLQRVWFTIIISLGYRGISAPMPGAPPPSASSQILISEYLFFFHIFLTPFFYSFCTAFFAQLPKPSHINIVYETNWCWLADDNMPLHFMLLGNTNEYVI